MPRGDGTGPMGLGPRTGRGAGYCTGSATLGQAGGGRSGLGGALIAAGRWAVDNLPRLGLGRGAGAGRGIGGGRGRRF